MTNSAMYQFELQVALLTITFAIVYRTYTDTDPVDQSIQHCYHLILRHNTQHIFEQRLVLSHTPTLLVNHICEFLALIVISAIYNIKAICHYYNHSYPEPGNNNADPAEPLPRYTEPERGIPRPVPPPRQSVLHTPRDSARAAAIRTRRSSSPEGQGNAEDLFG